MAFCALDDSAGLSTLCNRGRSSHLPVLLRDNPLYADWKPICARDMRQGTVPLDSIALDRPEQ
jgi:hypothetical protein